MKELSLDKPLKEGEHFTLLDVVPAPEDAYPTCSAEPRVKLPQARRSIEIDQDVVDALRERYGTMPLGRAIRIMLGLRPKATQSAWQEEEDELLRKYYPLYGSKHLVGVLDRSQQCIRDRTVKLGLKREWLYKRDRRGRKRK